MTKPYTDVFNKPLDPPEVMASARAVVQTKKAFAQTLQRKFGFGYGKASIMIELLEDAHVIGPLMSGKRSIILKTEESAINAAMRQLKKGKK